MSFTLFPSILPYYVSFIFLKLQPGHIFKSFDAFIMHSSTRIGWAFVYKRQKALKWILIKCE